MTGTILNVAAILIGGTVGLRITRDLSASGQRRLKYLLAVLTIYAGLSMTWSAIHGTFFQVLKQILIVLISITAGNAIGMFLGIQRGLNRLGEYAKGKLAAADGNKGNSRFSEGFVTCTLLFCVGPMAILGSLQDGLTGNFRVLAIKSVMDGLATMAFSRTFGWSVLLSAVPVLAYQGSISLAAKTVEPLLGNQAMLDSINATGGLLVLCITLIIVDVMRVPLANYLPSLVVAPALTWLAS